MTNIVVGTPYFGPYDKEHMNCMGRLNEAYPDIVTAQVNDCPYIDQAKSIIATKHMEDSDVVVIVDHDMIFEPEAVVQVAESALERRAIVGAAYAARMRGAKRPMAFVEKPVVFFEGGDVVPATIVAGGFLAIPTSCLRTILINQGWDDDKGKAETTLGFKAYPFFHCMVKNELWWGEDVSFCLRAREAGVGLFIDTRVRVGHKGSYVYHLEDSVFSVPRGRSMRINENGEAEIAK